MFQYLYLLNSSKSVKWDKQVHYLSLCRNTLLVPLYKQRRGIVLFKYIRLCFFWCAPFWLLSIGAFTDCPITSQTKLCLLVSGPALTLTLPFPQSYFVSNFFFYANYHLCMKKLNGHGSDQFQCSLKNNLSVFSWVAMTLGVISFRADGDLQ